MRNVETWQPSKIALSGGRPIPSLRGLSPSSYLIQALSLDAITPMLHVLKGHVADVGAGRVPFYALYRDQVSQVTCIDWDNSLHNITHADIMTDLNCPLPIREGTFDSILMTSVLEHIAEPSNLLAELFRTLKPNGHLLLEVPFMYWLHEEPYDYYRYTCHGLRLLAEKSGFEVVRLQGYGNPAAVVCDILSKVLVAVGNRAGGKKRILRFARPISRNLALLMQKIALWTFRLSPCSSQWCQQWALGYVIMLRKTPVQVR